MRVVARDTDVVARLRSWLGSGLAPPPRTREPAMTPRAAGAQDREAPCPAGRRARTIRGEGLGVPARRLPRGLQGRRPLRGSRCPAGAVVNNSFMPTCRTFVFAIYHRMECC